jgi:hypothetical protein
MNLFRTNQTVIKWPLHTEFYQSIPVPLGNSGNIGNPGNSGNANIMAVNPLYIPYNPIYQNHSSTPMK